MSVFRIPTGIIEDIHSMIINFYWGQRGTKRRAHWVRREEMVCAKEGGMGFWDLNGFNAALLAKQLWRLYQQSSSLVARIMQAKYYKNSSVLEATTGYQPSFLWRSLISAQDLLCEGLRWRVGDG
ncbi:unnamed protein product [Linum trigynum]|uniref:Uncharacterized protein n=1 Tax=Linum trigynum TaxID=586398 RepID=A0AAV2D8H5_9ROSI